MRKIRSQDTKPELIVRRLLWSLGYRYRLHDKDIPGKPDVVFKGMKKVIFVHGCFWHQHDSSICKIVRKPKSNEAYWNEKLTRNKQRDKDIQKEISDMGWEYLVIWECETKDQQLLKDRMNEFLE